MAILKIVVDLLATILVLPFWFVYRLIILPMPRRRIAWFQTFSQAFSLIPGLPGIVLRRAFYRLTLQRCQRHVSIGFGTIFSTPDADLGNHIYIGAFCSLGRVTLGDDVLLGSHVNIMSGKHQHHSARLDIPIRKQGGTFERVTVGRDSWIGNGAIVGSDVGEQAIVAAGAVVVKPVPNRSIVGGNPARVLGERGDGTKAETVSPE